MGPRIYPSYQDKNTESKGSLIINIYGNYTISTSFYINLYDRISGSSILQSQLVARPYQKLYFDNLKYNNPYTLQLVGTVGITKGFQLYRNDYMINDVDGNNGIVKNYITGATYTLASYNYLFTATTLNNSYNFEYELDYYINPSNPTPTPIPTMTPSPTPVPTFTPTPIGPTATPTPTPTTTPTPTPLPLPTGSLFYYDPGNILSYPGSGSVLYDLSGNNRTASINTGITWVSGSAAYFNLDGTDNNSITGTTLTQTLTSWSMWIGIYRNTQGDYDGFMTERTAPNDINGLGAYSTTDRLDLNVNNTLEITEAAPGRMTTGSWMFLGGAVDNTTYTTMVYKSGSIDTYISGSKAAGSSNFNNAIVLGEDKETGTDRTMNGRIGPAIMYDRKLSTTELTQINDYFKSRYGI